MTAALAPSRARAARLAVSVLFFANGALAASVLPRLPAIKEALGLSNAELGAAVAAMPVGGLIAGGLVGILIARFGSGRVAAVAGTMCCLLLAVVGLAPSWIALAGAYFVLGVFDATMDASMNTHGLEVQAVYGRSILQGLHGTWSAGGMAGGAVGAVAAAWGLPVAIHLALVAFALAAAVAGSSRWLLSRTEPGALPTPGAADGTVADTIHLRHAGRLARVLVPIAMLGILCVVVQSSAATWSAVYVTDVLKGSAGVAASAFVVYIAAMTVGRLTNDRWVDRLGPVLLVRIGAVIAAAGLVAAMAAGPLGLTPLAFVGFAAIGYGSSPMFPVMVLAAGSRPGIPPGYGVALVSWMVRIGLVLAPAIIGVAADAAGLGAAFGIPLVTAVVIVVVAPAMTGTRPRQARATAT
jgi:fucose permease